MNFKSVSWIYIGVIPCQTQRKISEKNGLKSNSWAWRNRSFTRLVTTKHYLIYILKLFLGIYYTWTDHDDIDSDIDEKLQEERENNRGKVTKETKALKSCLKKWYSYIETLHEINDRKRIMALLRNSFATMGKIYYWSLLRQKF